MKILITVISLLSLCAGLRSLAQAQDEISRTYTGTNGPQSGPGLPLPTPDNYVVNVYGGFEQFAIVVASPAADICGREFYFTGTVSFQPNQLIGSIGGPMQRCTNPDLVVFCDHKPIYEVGYTGTVERNTNDSRYLIKITWPDEKWLVEDCQKKRVDRGSEEIRLYFARRLPPNTPDPDSWTEWARKKIAGGDQHVRDVISGRSYDTSGLR